MKNYVVLDQGWDLLGFAAQAPALTGGNLEFRTIPTGRTDLPTPEDGAAVQVDPQQIRSFIATLTTPAPPPPPPSSPPPSPGLGPDPAGPAHQDVTVDVRNGAAVSGLADRVLAALVRDGFTAGQLGNTTARTITAVDYGTGGLAAAQRVAAALGGVALQPDPAVGPGRVEVGLGTDYTGPGLDGRTPAAPAPAPPEPPPVTVAGVPCIN